MEDGICTAPAHFFPGVAIELGDARWASGREDAPQMIRVGVAQPLFLRNDHISDELQVGDIVAVAMTYFEEQDTWSHVLGTRSFPMVVLRPSEEGNTLFAHGGYPHMAPSCVEFDLPVEDLLATSDAAALSAAWQQAQQSDYDEAKAQIVRRFIAVLAPSYEGSLLHHEYGLCIDLERAGCGEMPAHCGGENIDAPECQNFQLCHCGFTVECDAHFGEGTYVCENERCTPAP